MEALTAASVAALTIYDMLKAVERGIVIESVRLLSKEGGKSGSYRAAKGEVTAAGGRSRAVRRASAVTGPVRRSHVRVKPVEIMNEVAGRKPPSDHNARREAFRQFMTSRSLTAHAWAKDAGLPVGAIYSFLHGRTHALTKSEEEKLARAAGVAPEDLYRG
jgi:hypothetical protein